MSSGLFSGAWSKWERGNFHLDALVVEMPAWLHENPYRALPEVNADGTKYVMRVSHQGGDPPVSWGLAVGDALFNFRGALDHALYSLAVVKSGLDPPPRERDLQFPITDAAPKFEEAVKRGRLGALAAEPAIRNAIESVQPHGRVDADGEPFGLWFLHKLNNADKHRRINVVVSHITSGGLNVIPPTDPPMTVTAGQQFSFDWHRGAIEDGTPVFTWTSDIAFFPPDMKVKQDLVLTPCVRHDAGGSGEQAGCAWLLRRVRDAVEHAVRMLESLA